MSYTPSGKLSKSMIRVFHIPTAPTVADPARLIACWEEEEISSVSPVYKNYNDFTELKQVIVEQEYELAFNDGRRAGQTEILNNIGMSPRTYMDLVRLKAEGSVVSIYATVADAPDMNDFVDPSITQSQELDKAIEGSASGVYSGTVTITAIPDPEGRTIASGVSTGFLSNAITITNRIEDKTND
jgi:hypothetical protein